MVLSLGAWLSLLLGWIKVRRNVPWSPLPRQVERLVSLRVQQVGAGARHLPRKQGVSNDCT
jgi:hypothetical protein